MNWFDKAQHHLKEQLPFVLFNKPNSTQIVGVFQRNAQLFALTDFTESGFAFVSFDGKQRYYLPLEQCDVIVDFFVETDFHVSSSISMEISTEAKINFEQLVQSGVEAIKNNAFQKVVLSRQETVEIHSHVITIFQKLVTQYKSAFNYCFFHPQIGLWLGATPEQFIKLESNTLKTVALAGTQVYNDNLVWETKEKEEQRFVTDFITNNLRLFSENVTKSEPQTIQAGNLAHLKTEISAEIDPKRLANIVEQLHPTPAVCGLPKEPAKRFILKNEGYNREFYTGFLGELNIDFTSFKQDNSDLFVNLRCMKMVDNQATIFVGCGITKDSNPEKEFIETVNKSITMKKVLV